MIVATRENKFSMLTREIKETSYIDRNKYPLYPIFLYGSSSIFIIIFDGFRFQNITIVSLIIIIITTIFIIGRCLLRETARLLPS